MGIEVMEAGFPVVSEYENERRRKSEFTRGLNVKSVNSAKIVQKARRN
jgi:isopropylmalate/homocitrate/citramalate synthase